MAASDHLPAATDEQTLHIVFANQHRDFHCCSGVHRLHLHPSALHAEVRCAILSATSTASTFVFFHPQHEFEIQLCVLNLRLACTS